MSAYLDKIVGNRMKRQVDVVSVALQEPEVPASLHVILAHPRHRPEVGLRETPGYSAYGSDPGWLMGQ